MPRRLFALKVILLASLTQFKILKAQEDQLQIERHLQSKMLGWSRELETELDDTKIEQDEPVIDGLDETQPVPTNDDELDEAQ